MIHAVCRYSFFCLESWEAKTARSRDSNNSNVSGNHNQAADSVRLILSKGTAKAWATTTSSSKAAAMPAFRFQEGQVSPSMTTTNPPTHPLANHPLTHPPGIAASLPTHPQHSRCWSGPSTETGLSVCRMVLASSASQDYCLGKSMVFIRDPKTLHAIEERRARLLPSIVTRVQASSRPAHIVRPNQVVQCVRTIQLSRTVHWDRGWAYWKKPARHTRPTGRGWAHHRPMSCVLDTCSVCVSYTAGRSTSNGKSVPLSLTRRPPHVCVPQARVRAWLQRSRYMRAVKDVTVVETQTRRLLHVLR